MKAHNNRIAIFAINTLCQVRLANQTALRAQARRVDRLHTEIAEEQKS